VFFVEELGADLHAREKLYKENNILELVISKAVLDVGCGTGYFVDRIAPYANEVIGIDIDEKNVEIARKIARCSNVQFLVGNGMDLPFPENYFDVLFCASVLEHFSDPIKALKEFHRVIKPQGLFILGFDKKPTFSSFLFMLPWWLTNLWYTSSDNPQIHKLSIFTDVSSRTHWFLNVDKVKEVLSKNFSLEKMVYGGGIITNVLIIFFISIEKIWDRLTRYNTTAFSNIGYCYERLNTPLMRFYRKVVLPVVKFLVNHDFLKKDGQFCLLICRKK